MNVEMEQRKQNLKNILENQLYVSKSTRREAILYYVAVTATALFLVMYGVMLSNTLSYSIIHFQNTQTRI